MNILFVHQNFPGQFRHLAAALAGQGHDVRALCLRQGGPTRWAGVQVLPYAVQRGSTAGVHPWVADLETKVIRGEACFRAAQALDAGGFRPQIIIAHPGWGESLFLKQVWPSARLGLYCEYFYRARGADVGFDPEFPVADAAAEACRLQLKNLNQLLHLEAADQLLAPTRWQASTYGAAVASRMTVVHDGIDTDAIVPDAQVQLQLQTRQGVRPLSRDDEIITFVNRQLEPYRGYHVFMRALPALLRRRPRARVLIVGGDGVSYGAGPDPLRYGQRSWKQIFIDEVRPQIADEDWSRVHFLGSLPYAQFLSLLQLSTVHVYLTYPFVLSWSLLEAMSAGCAVVASDTAPVREVLAHDVNGRLVDFFDHQALVGQVCDLLDDPAARLRLGTEAREGVRRDVDLRCVCLPQQLAWVEQLASGAQPTAEG